LAARSLVNRDCILIWLSSEWDETLLRPNKAADEERSSILRIFADVIQTLSGLELQRRERDADSESKGDETVSARPTWLTDVGMFIKKAAIGAGMSNYRYICSRDSRTDSERLEALSKMLLQTSTVELNTEAFLALTNRLGALKSQSSKTTENLFEASLNLAPTEFDLKYRKEQLQGAVDGLRRQVTRSKGEVGDWARKEVRQAIFERETGSVVVDA
jgi:hypothetical protein